MLKNNLQKAFRRKKKQIAVLIDPGKLNIDRLKDVVSISDKSGVDYFFVGGSHINETSDNTISIIKKISNLPVILFPGSVLQLSKNADALLFLSLISGRNPEYLIGHHVIAAPLLKKSNIEILPTGYILIEGGNTTSVEYISNTRPIPSSKKDIIAATAMAGEMLGLQQLYIDAGSGAINTIHADLIKHVKKHITVPLIAGGGITCEKDAYQLFLAGADMIVIGSITELYPNKIHSIVNAGKLFK